MAEVETQLAAARQESATNERARILAVQNTNMPGHEKLVAEMVNDGKTTGNEAAARVLAAEKSKIIQVGADLAADAPKPAPAAPADNAAAQESAPDSKQLAKQAQAYIDAEAKEGRKVSYATAVRHVANNKQE
jgi:hypothetical protein